MVPRRVDLLALQEWQAPGGRHLPSLNFYKLPICYINSGSGAEDAGNKFITVGDWMWVGQSLNPSSSPVTTEVSMQPCTDPRTYDWGENQVYGGQSSHPSFAIVGSTPVLLGCFYAGGWVPGSRVGWSVSPYVSFYTATINAAMTTLHGSAAYQLSPISLSGYPTY